jgi:hypothetical protein
MATQYAGTDRGFTKIIQGGAPDWKDYTQIRKLATAAYPGWIVSGNGETAGEVDVAAAEDGLASYFEIILERVGASPQDIDTEIAVGSFVRTLRPSGGRFIVAATRADESNNTELGEPMVLEASGMLKKWAYTDGTDITDSVIDGNLNCHQIIRCAEVTTDVADTDLVQLVYW